MRRIGQAEKNLEAAQQVGVNSSARCLIDAAQSLFFDKAENVLQLKFDESYPRALQTNAACASLVCWALLNHGFLKGQADEIHGAIADYTAAIELPGAPSGQGAKTLCYRGVAKRQDGDSNGEIADFSYIIALKGAPLEIVALAGSALTELGSH